MASLKSSLKDAVRRLAFSTSVDQLKKRGVKNVNVVGLDRIVQLIEEAVHRSLKNRLLVGDRMAVADATKEVGISDDQRKQLLEMLSALLECKQHPALAKKKIAAAKR